MENWRKVFKTKWFSIEGSSGRSLGKRKPYYRFTCKDSVEILALTPKRQIILVRQFRPALGVYTLELPSGYVEKNESVRKAAARELREETGFVCRRIRLLGILQIVPSRINNRLYIFFAEAAQGKSLKNSCLEKDVVLIKESEFRKLILENKFKETAGLAIYFLAKFKKLL